MRTTRLGPATELAALFFRISRPATITARADLPSRTATPKSTVGKTGEPNRRTQRPFRRLTRRVSRTIRIFSGFGRGPARGGGDCGPLVQHMKRPEGRAPQLH